MLVLRVGDPHTKINNLADSERLLNYVAEVAVSAKVDRIEILGDLFHNHAVVRVEILEFWNDWLDRLSMICETFVLVGNHDQTGNYGSNMHALSTLKRIPNGMLHIIDRPICMFDNLIAYMPYVHDQETFVKQANELLLHGAKVLVCHQTFNGAKYDNGMYAPDGFDPELLNYPLVISGHIHTRQRFGKVIYPGTAKWDTLSDANEEKGIWLVEHDDTTGAIVSEKFLDTAPVCTPIYSVQWKEGDTEPQILPGRFTIELIGSSEWVKAQKEKLKGKCSVKAKITDKAKRESRKIKGDLSHFVASNFEPMTGVSRDQILEAMKEMKLV